RRTRPAAARARESRSVALVPALALTVREATGVTGRSRQTPRTDGSHQTSARRQSFHRRTSAHRRSCRRQTSVHLRRNDLRQSHPRQIAGRARADPPHRGSAGEAESVLISSFLSEFPPAASPSLSGGNLTHAAGRELIQLAGLVVSQHCLSP